MCAGNAYVNFMHHCYAVTVYGNPLHNDYIAFAFYLVCPAGTAYHECSWNLSCSDITGVRRCKDQTSCTSGCFCSDGTVLKDGVCSNASYCSGTSMLTAHHTITL